MRTSKSPGVYLKVSAPRKLAVFYLKRLTKRGYQKKAHEDELTVTRKKGKFDHVMSELFLEG